MIRLCPRVVIPRLRTVRVPRGERGTAATARLLARLIDRGSRDFYVRQKAIQILRAARVPPRDRRGEVAALFEWVRGNVRYTRDIWKVELLHSARRMLELRAGDCDDMTILLGAMLQSIGHPVRLVLAGYRPDRPSLYTHVYPEVNVGGRWLAADATLPRPLGWPPRALWRRVCEIEKEDLRCLHRTR